MSYSKINTIDKNKKLSSKLSKNPYLHDEAKIVNIRKENNHVYTFTLEPAGEWIPPVFNYKPGQFAIWSLPGVGEAPFSYASHRTNRQIQFTIHKVGKVTNAIFKIHVGDIIGIRGPYGNGFPMDEMRGRDLLFVMGGIGSAPLRGVLHYVMDHEEEFGNICIFHGARNPDEMLFKDEFESYIDNPTINCMLTVDSSEGYDNWIYNEGVVTTLFEKYEEIKGNNKIITENTTALVCGPPVMYKFVLDKLLERGIRHDQIYMTLERRMKCGIGKCGHCVIDYVYTCIEGPVFTYWDAMYFKDVI